MNPVSGYTLYIIIAAYCFCAQADSIRIHNKTDKNVWAAVYIRQFDKLVRIEDQFLIKSKSKAAVLRPSIRISMERYLIADSAKDVLQELILIKDLPQYHKVNVDVVNGHDFYICTLQNDVLRLLHKGAWRALQKEKNSPLLSKSRFGAKQRPVQSIINNKHSSDAGIVRIGNELDKHEKQYRKKRIVIVQKALEKVLHRSLDGCHIPTIAIVMSGSGYEAMMASMGQVQGLEKIGLLDAITYIAASSGPALFLATWTNLALPIKKYIHYMIPVFTKNILSITAKEADLMAESLIVKSSLQQPVTSLDVFNGFLINKFFGSLQDKRHRMYLSDQIETIQSGLWPFPIYSAVNIQKSPLVQWYEFTPYAIGASWLGMYIPSWSMGRKFNNNISIDFNPEQPLPLGLWGASLFEKSCDYYARLQQSIDNQQRIQQFMQSKIDQSASFYTLYNFTSTKSKSSLSGLKYIRMTDPLMRLDQGLPYFAVSADRSERVPDIILFVTLGNESNIIDGMHEVYAYAQRQGHYLPLLTLNEESSEQIAVFKDVSDNSVPVIMCMSCDPLKHIVQYERKNNDRKDTRTYTVPQIKKMIAYAQDQLVANKQTLIDTIKWVIATRSKK
jgi:hypothetical protein